MPERILRLAAVKELCGLSRSTIYQHICQRLFPKPILLGARAVGWREAEITAVNAARIRGASIEEILSLVAKLEAARKSAA